MADLSPRVFDATPHVGIGPIRLGMTREAVRAAVGEPEAIDFFAEGEVCTENWYYGDGAVEVSFDADDPLLVGDISGMSAEVTLKGVTLVGRDVAELHALVERVGIDDLVLDEDFDESGLCFRSDAHGLMIWAADDEIVNFTLFPRYDATGDVPQWPKP
jgi:hypothetical protein